jgi:hypothetical protein
MKVVPSLSNWITAYRVHRRFASRPGSQHVATCRSLTYLAAIVSQYKPKTVLEFGAGIGTITYLLLSANSKPNVIAVEANPFCLAQLDQNIPHEFKPRLSVVTLDDARLNRRFDLIVIDGAFQSFHDYSFLQQGTICFIDGNRLSQAERLTRIAKTRNLVCDVEKQSFGLFRLRWRKRKLSLPWRKIGYRFPVLEPVKRKTCRVGMLRAIGPREG